MKSIFTVQDLFVYISLGCFLLSFLVQLFFYLYYFRKAIIGKSELSSKERNDKEPVSVIICARNEADNLSKNLPLILEQNYSNYEVIVVDDRSEDETKELLTVLAGKYPRLKVSRVKNDPKFTHGKKLAITLGIKASANDWLLFTDADCQPAGENWVSQMQKNFHQKTEIVLGYGGFLKEQGLLNLIIRFDAAMTALTYFGMARAGKPYMGVGRNLAYRKSLFFKNNGFASHTGLKSGDDDLFVNETANAWNIACELHPDSFTWSSAEKKFRDWIWQKRRHLTTGTRYSKGSKTRLIAENLSRIFLLISFVILLFQEPFRYYAAALFIMLYILKAVIFKIFFSGLNERYLFLPSLLLEPVQPFFYSYLHFRNFIDKNHTKWK